jgi:hypothetical protein
MTWASAARGGRNKDRHRIVVRVIRYTLNEPQRVGHQEVHTLTTNLLDEVQYPAGELIPGYHEHWKEWSSGTNHFTPTLASTTNRLIALDPLGPGRCCR